jgi:AraC-like DNA-binding protein
MSSPEQAAGLVAAARKRHEYARRQAVNALRHLDAAGAPINMSAVARAAGVSRSWLYRQTDLRTTIEHLREAWPHAGSGTTPSAQRATTDSLRHQLETLRARHAELQAENRELKAALARKLGQQRAEPLAGG